MRKQTPRRLDFEVDKLTNSIENVLTGEIFETDVVRVALRDLETINQSEWVFDWNLEFAARREIFKLMIRGNSSTIQGLISLEDRHDHIFIYLIESASFNKGKSKLFHGVPANLVAFACKNSFERGYDGYVQFVAKSRLIEHYERTLGAKRFWGNNMLLNTEAAIRLIHSYYKDFDVTRFQKAR